jgi:Tfp pilus assembly protein PilV
MMKRYRKGLSLLEVILSIAILGGSLAAIGQLVRLGVRNAIDTRMRNEANILADTKMAEISAGVIDTESSGRQPIQENPEWTYELEMLDSSQLGLLLAKLTIAQANLDDPLEVVIHAYLPDPDYDPLATEEVE